MAAIIFTIYYVVSNYGALPNRIPIHYDFNGKPNNWGSKAMLWIMPILSIVLYFVFSTVSRYPHTFNYGYEITEENAANQYSNAVKLMILMKTEVMVFLSIISMKTIELAQGKNVEVGLIPAVIFVVVLLSTIVYFIMKMRKFR